MFIQNVVWGADGTWLAGSGDDGVIYVWNAADGTLLQRLTAHHSPIVSVAASPVAARIVAAGGAGGGLCVWDVERGEQAQIIAGEAESLRVVIWGASENLLVSGSADGTLRWWDLQRAACVLVREAHEGAVEALKRSPDGTRLASCGDDGAIMLWDLHSGEHLRTLRRDRPYERMDITGLAGITPAQRASLITLGAVEGVGNG